MAVKNWLGTHTVGQWGVDDNWLDGDGVVTTIPVGGDDVYLVSGSQSVTADFDQTGLGSALNSLNFGPGWTGSIATSLEIDAVTVNYATKTGSAFLEGTYTNVNIEGTSSDDPALKFTDSTIATMNITGGSGRILVTGGPSDITVGINMIGASGAELEIAASVDLAAADVTIDAGKFVTYEELSDLVQFGGTVEFVNASGTTTSITIYDGICRYKPTSSAVLSTLTMYGGFFDMRDCVSPSHTITNTTIYSGAVIDERNSLSSTVWSTAIDGRGGQIKADFNRDITIT